MNAELYRKLQQLLLAGEAPQLTSALEPEQLGREQLVWPGGKLGEDLSGAVYTQTLNAPVRLVICGGGHVAQALAPAALQVGFRVTVLENRPDILEQGHFPPEAELRCGAFEELLAAPDFGSDSFYAIMTRGHKEDWTCVRAVLNRQRGYLGMIGSRKKVAATREMLLEAGIAQEEIDSIHAPIGLAIGAETPAEIAVSIVAQLIQCRKALGREAPLEHSVIAALDRTPYAMVTLVDCQGSSPRGPGARMLVFPDGSIEGTIGGGISEAYAKTRGIQALETGKAELGTYRLDGTAGSICGGCVQYLVIPVKEDTCSC
jgi:xanthine dehydrogenase accessory factor